MYLRRYHNQAREPEAGPEVSGTMGFLPMVVLVGRVGLTLAASTLHSYGTIDS